MDIDMVFLSFFILPLYRALGTKSQALSEARLTLYAKSLTIMR
jgi:hypothetical protein